MLFATLRQKAWQWRNIKFGHFEFCGIFFPLFGNSLLPRDFVPSASIIGQYSQKMVLNKSCALCDSTSKGVSVACRQSWFCGLFFHCLERTPRDFVCSASKFLSTLGRCNLRKVVLFATLRQRPWQWCAVKFGHFEFCGIFFCCLGTHSRDFCPFCF